MRTDINMLAHQYETLKIFCTNKKSSVQLLKFKHPAGGDMCMYIGKIKSHNFDAQL